MESLDRKPFAVTDDEGGRKQRAKSRDSLFLIARMTLADETAPRDVRIRNLSEGGLMIEIERSVPTGTSVALVLRGVGEISGSVAWCAEGRIGIAFDRRIDPYLARKPVGGGERTPIYAKPLLGARR